MEKQKIEVKKNLEYTEAIAYMEALLQSLKAGTIVVQSGEDHITMTPAEHIGIKVEAKSKKGKQKFGLEISWTEGSSTDLTITDKEPAAPPATKESAEVAAREEAKTPANRVKAETPAEKPEAKTPAKKTTAKKKTDKKSKAKKSSK